MSFNKYPALSQYNKYTVLFIYVFSFKQRLRVPFGIRYRASQRSPLHAWSAGRRDKGGPPATSSKRAIANPERNPQPSPASSAERAACKDLEGKKKEKKGGPPPPLQIARSAESEGVRDVVQNAPLYDSKWGQCDIPVSTAERKTGISHFIAPLEKKNKKLLTDTGIITLRQLIYLNNFKN